jgi:sporulation protein YlmC with PRC-barrel domain
MEEVMLAKLFACASLGLAVVSAPAQGQTSLQAGSTTALARMQPDQWQASKLEGLEVYNTNNEKIGDISELVLDRSGRIEAVVIGVGGFLGIGGRDVAIAFDRIRFVNEPRANASGSTTGSASLAGNSPGGGQVASPAATGTVAVPADPPMPANTNMATNNADANRPSAPGSAGDAAPTAGAGDRFTPHHAVVTFDITKDQLMAAPEFQRPR